MEKQLLIWILVIVGICLVLTILALVDILTKDFGSAKAKFFWHFVALIPLVGWLIYLLIGFRKGSRRV